MFKMPIIFLLIFTLIHSAHATTFGTGFVINNSGHIVTCAHCVPEGKTVTVLTKNGSSYEAEILFRDKYLDLACVKIDAATPSYLKIGDSDKMRPLDDVYVFGFPLPSTLGLEISAASGNFNTMRKDGDLQLMQIDVPLNDGNSGGPIVGRWGDLLGVAVSKLDSLTMLKNHGTIPERVNFAIPSSLLIKKLNQHQINFEFADISKNTEEMRDDILASTVQIVSIDKPQHAKDADQKSAFYQERLKKACKLYVESGSLPAKQQMHKFYDKVDFYDKGILNKKDVYDELEKYNKKWTDRNFKLNKILKLAVDEETELGAAVVEFSFNHQNRERKVAGKGQIFILVDISQETPQVLSVREHITQRQ